MTLSNWIEIGIAAAVLIMGVVTKCITRRKRKRVNTLLGVGNDEPGVSWRMR